MTTPSPETKALLIKLIARADRASARKKLMHAIDYLQRPESYTRPHLSRGHWDCGAYDRVVLS